MSNSLHTRSLGTEAAQGRPPRNKNQEKEVKRTYGEIRVLVIVSASSQVKDKH